MSEAQLAATLSTFRKWLYLPDATPALAMLGTVAANLGDGDPVWMLLVGPPGGGKSELLTSVSEIPHVHPAATLTEAALLSGTPKREHDDDAHGGLLRAIGDFGIILAKDFGSVLSMNRDARAQVLAALREVYDGSWTRHVGTDGGRTLHWTGKVGLVAGCTPTIDRHHAVMGAMGERFMLCRLPEVNAAEQARWALRHAGREAEMRRELTRAVAGLFSSGLKEPSQLVEQEREQLVHLATFTARARSAVERDGYSREIELIPEPEAPTRLIIVLDRLLAGLDTLGTSRCDAWAAISRCALDSIPALRLACIVDLVDRDEAETSAIAERVGYPTTTARRALEELHAHGLVNRIDQGKGHSHAWKLTAWARDTYGAIRAFPEMSECIYTSPLRIGEDKSGKVSEVHLRTLVAQTGAL